jgi:hypothetical protein
MKRPILFFVLPCTVLTCMVFACMPLLAADSPWLYGRIEDVSKSVANRTKAWVVNTPITEDETTYTVSVHVGDKIIIGTYDLTAEQTAPPEEWTASYPVKVQLVADRIYLRAPTGDLSLHIVRRKTVKLMKPLTADEKRLLEQVQAPAGSLVGFAEEAKPTDEKARAATGEAAPQPAPQPPPQPEDMGTVTVRSTPYLSEVFVDGDSMGYTPAKINLRSGKHAFRVEKPGYKVWTKEIMITVGSELSLDASLEKK